MLVSIQEIHKPELNAQLQAEKIAAQLEKRIAFRRAMRKAVEESLRFGAQGIKVKVSGRLNGAEIAVANGICRVSYLCTHCALTSTTVWRKRKRRLARSVSRFGFTVERFLIRKRQWLAVPAPIQSMKRGRRARTSTTHTSRT